MTTQTLAQWNLDTTHSEAPVFLFLRVLKKLLQ